jgi:hypothetical protein
VRYVHDVILQVSCLTTQSSAMISNTVAFYVVDRVGTGSSRQIRY